MTGPADLSDEAWAQTTLARVVADHELVRRAGMLAQAERDMFSNLVAAARQYAHVSFEHGGVDWLADCYRPVYELYAPVPVLHEAMLRAAALAGEEPEIAQLPANPGERLLDRFVGEVAAWLRQAVLERMAEPPTTEEVR